MVLPLRNITWTRSPFVSDFQGSSCAVARDARNGSSSSAYFMESLYHSTGAGSKSLSKPPCLYGPGAFVLAASRGQTMTPDGVMVARKDLVYLRCLETSAVISNMLTCFLPLNTAFSTSSALIMRLLALSWSPCFLMYTQSFFATSLRGRGFGPVTFASSSLG